MATNVFDKVLSNIESDIAAYKSSGISVCEDMANNRIVFWDMNGNNPQQTKYDVDAYKSFLTTLQERYELIETERGTLGSPFSYKYEIKPKQTKDMKVTETPLMKQYEEMKKKHPDAILLFRVGDFYESFKEDAQAVSEICGVTLTTRANGANGEKVYLAGFPKQALDTYLPILVRAGKRAAICEQLEDPKLSAKIVKREEPKPKKQPKPKETKIYGMSDIEFDKLNPDNIIASFRVRIPEDCKPMAKCVDKKDFRDVCNHVFVQPSTGKLLATDTRIMTIADVECKGQWPEDTEEIKGSMSILKRYIAPISADALSKYAGQEIDVVTYNQDGNATTLITSETAIPAISSLRLKANVNYPDWQRVWFKDEQCVEKIRLTEDALGRLREWMKKNKSKNNQRIEINVNYAATIVEFSLWEEKEYNKWEQICEPMHCDLTGDFPRHDIHMTFNARYFEINIMDGFSGEIWFAGLARPIKFCGGQRESILMPMHNERDKFSE